MNTEQTTAADTKEKTLSDFLALTMEKENSRKFPKAKEARRLALRVALLEGFGMHWQDLATCIAEERNFRG